MLEKAVFRGFYACLKSVLFACVSCMMFVFGEISFAYADETYPFSITTTTLPSGNNAFTFKMSAGGTFYVDCGTDGTLSGTIGVSGNTITRTTTDYSSYACSYTSGGVKTIRFGGTAVAYSPDTLYPAISFMNNQMIASLSGDLSALFPVSDNNIPTFYQTFYGCTSLTSIPSTLFSFGGNDVPAQEEMFFGTFAGCTGLKSIPSGLFSHIVSGASYAFTATFMGCSGLGTDSDVVAIPADLFSFGGNDVSGETGMFSQTFEGCEGLKSIPSGLFSHVISSAETMFSSTFADCANLGTDSDVVAIPNDLFSFGGNNVSGQDEMFMSTFVNCTGLKSIPSGLFSHVTSGAVDMFNRTFAGCEGLNGNGDSNQNFIPPSLFEGLINESNPSQSPYETDMMDYIFYDTTLRTRCPENYYQFITGYEDYWDEHVSCKPCPEGKTSSEGSTSIDQCIEPEEIDDPKSPAEITYPFSITTTELSDKNFQFRIFAAGTFYVDCGTGGTLTSDASPSDISGNSEGGFIINRSNVVASSENRGNVYTCSYSNTNSRTIRFGGQATGYFGDFQVIGFNISASGVSLGSSDDNVKKISSISGSLGQIFGTIENPSIGYSQPKFFRTFSYATNMTGTTESISDPNNSGMNYALPPTLFSGISGAPAEGMFSSTFYGCSGLTGSIPSTLFSGISGDPARDMFSHTFRGCSGLTGSIPSTLFSGISGDPAKNMFSSTFSGCSGLTGSIPSTLFSRISGDPAEGMFEQTFGDCSGLSSIPSTLFSGISGDPAGRMFAYTFHGCSGLTGSIPSGLFSGISGQPAEGMFMATFSGCSRLTGSIPSGLFGNIDGTPAKQMFYYTFNNCSNLTGTNIPDEDNQDKKYAIPPTLFGNLTGDPAEGMFSHTFAGCMKLDGTIPGGLFSGISGAPAKQMFSNTFRICVKLKGSIPGGLFSGIDGEPAEDMFGGTFVGCSGLTGSIPSGLFGNIYGEPAESMFKETFVGCSGLTGSIPSGLFGNIYGTPAKNMFNSTFDNCSNLTGFGDTTYVPWTFLNAITDNNEIQNQATEMFSGTPLNNPCPADTYDVTRPQFSDAEKPWCKPCPPDTHSPAGSDELEDCVAGNILTYNCGIATGNAWSDENLYTEGASVPMPETIDEHCNASDLGRIFTGWICNESIVPDSNNQIVMPGESVTCTAQWDECDNANNYWWNIDNTECVQGHKITLKLVASCLEPQYPIEPTVLYTIPTRGAYLDEERTLLMSKTENPIQLPHVEFIANFDTNAPLNPDNNDIQYSVPEVASVNLNNYRYHCPFTMSPSSYGYNSFGNCFIHNHPVDYLTLSDTDHISGLTPENRNGYLTDDGIYQAEYQNQDQIWWINGCAYSGMPAIISPSLTGYTFDNWCTDVTGTMGCFKGQVPNTIAENTTYYAHWTPKHYTVTYNKGAHADANSENYVDAYICEVDENTEECFGGATFDAQYTALSFDEAPISEHMSVATGYVFVGWTTDSTPIFEDGVLQNEFTGYEYWKRDSNLTVYAAYTCADGYFVDKNGNCVNDRSVTYDCNNGTEKQTVSYINGQTVVPDFDCAVPGNNDEYEFAGWYCSYGNDSITLSVANTGDYGVAKKVYENFVYWSGMPGDGFSIDQNVHCIAVWQKKRIECPNNEGMSWKYVLNAPVDTQLADDYIDTNVSSYDYGSANDFTMNFTYGIVYAYSSCNTTQGVPGLVGEPDKNSYGNHCWCQVRAMSGSSNISFWDDIATWIYLESEDSCSETCRERCEVEAAKTSKGWLGDNDMSFREILYTHDLCNYRIDYDCGDGVVSNVNVVMGLNYELSTPASVCQIPTGYVVDEDGDDVIGGGWICNAEHANSFENQRLGIPDVLGNNGDIWTSYDNYMCQIQLECDTDNGYYPKNGVCVNDYGITYTSSIPAGVTVNGMPNPLTVEVPAGTEYTLAQLPTATGYNITGWDCGEDAPVMNNTITMPSTGIACSLVWSCDTDNGYYLDNGICVNNYGITYVSSIPAGVTVNGMPDPLTVDVPAGTEDYQLAPLPTATGYNITGWDCGEDAPVTNNTITMPSTGITCSLVWNCDTDNGYYPKNGVCVNDYGITYTSSIPAGVTVNGMPDQLTVEVPAGTENYTLAQLPTAIGYDITGWDCGNNVTVSANNTITMPATAITCSVVWSCDTANGYRLINGVCNNEYTITYSDDLPDGVTVDGMPDPLTEDVPAGTEEYELADLPTATGYNITGWDCGNNVTVSSNNTITMPAMAITCSLVWGCDTANGYRLVNGVCNNTYSVIYSCGESSGVAPTTNTYAIYGEQFTPANNTCDVPNGAVFAGWGVSGTDDIVSGSFTWNYTEDKTFTAMWGCDTGHGYQWNAAHDACVFVCDTGKWLHIGDERMCLYTNKPSSPALAIKIGEEIYYLRMESGDEGLKINDHSNKKFKIEREGILYNVSDISTL